MASSSVSSTTGKNLLLTDLLNSNLAITNKSMITNEPSPTPITSYSTIGTDTSSSMLHVTSRTQPESSISSTSTPSDSVSSVNTLSSSASQMSISISTSASTLSAPLDGNNTGTIILPVAISLVLIIVILVIALLVTICILVSYRKRAKRTLPITSNEDKLTKPDIDALSNPVYQPGNTNGQLPSTFANPVYSDGK